jgi:hypothetical protein
LLDYSAAAFNGILLARGSSPMLEEQTDQIVFADDLAKVRKAKNGINISNPTRTGMSVARRRG